LAADGRRNLDQGHRSGDGYLELVASETTTSRLIGLSKGDSSTSRSDVDFALYLANGGSLQVWSPA